MHYLISMADGEVDKSKCDWQDAVKLCSIVITDK